MRGFDEQSIFAVYNHKNRVCVMIDFREKVDQKQKENEKKDAKDHYKNSTFVWRLWYGKNDY